MDQVRKAADRTRAADVRAERAPAAPALSARTSPAAPPPRSASADFSQGDRGPAPGFEPPPPADEPPPPGGVKARIKRLVLKLMRPFFPLIRLLGLPLHQDIRETQRSLHRTDVRLDDLYFQLDRRFESLDRQIHLQTVAFEENLAAVAERVETRLDRLEQELALAGLRTDKTELRLDLLEERIKDLDESMEYIRLLHNLDHNLVLELTKLRIEFDTLKSKFGILEKDLDYLRARERALEETHRP